VVNIASNGRGSSSATGDIDAYLRVMPYNVLVLIT
jgi:hypothetical protein